MYTYDVQYVDFRFDQVKEMGEIDIQGAVKAFRSFPFKEQQQKARSLSEATFPTIRFRSHPDKWVLAIWSLLSPTAKKGSISRSGSVRMKGI